MKKEVILILSDAGNIGKTYIASLILETLRLKTEVDAYVCDPSFQGLYDRFGTKDKSGFRMPLSKQNPSKGVGFLNISDPSEKSNFSSCLNTKAEFVLFDLPANSTEALATCMGTPQDLIDFMDFDDAKPTFVVPIKDQKSVISYENLRATFPNEAFVIFINAGAIIASYGANKKQALLDIADFKKKFSNETVICLDHVVSDRVFSLLENATFREVFVPRVEREIKNENPDTGVVSITYSALDDAFLAKDRGDQWMLNRLIPEATKKISEVFI
jgi:hypothetical protein